MIHHRLWLTATIIAVAFATAGGAEPDRSALLRRIDASLEKAGHYLVNKQSPDGAWRSETYGALRDGPSLTSFVISGLWFLPQAGPEGQAAFRRGAGYMAGFVDERGLLRVGPRELLFPVYTAAGASRMIVHAETSPRYLSARQAWLTYLRGRQLTEELGWQPSDPEYGGWGFSLDVPRKPPTGQPKEMFFESNLAATIFAVAALRSAKTPDGDPAFRRALVFIERCQNFNDKLAENDAAWDDGGFFFMPDDVAQNKAGIAGKDRDGRVRFHSYGTMTADGVRALLRCGLPADHPRVVVARKWLERNFSADRNPGIFEPDRAVLRDATYYYWTWAAAHAFLALGVDGRPPKGSTPRIESVVDWPEKLAKALLHRQQPDGTWTNRYTDAKEDDPLIATSWAVASLAICRTMLAGGQATRPDSCRGGR